MSVNKNVVSLEEYAAVYAAIENGYIKGFIKGDFDLIATTFHPTATMHGFMDGKLLAGSFANLKAYIDAHGGSKDMRWRIDILHMTTTMASVRVEIENITGRDYTDFHTLMKLNGKWQVMAKLFHQYDRS